MADAKTPTGIEAALEGPESGGVAAIGRRLLVVMRRQQVGVTARQGERGEAPPEILACLTNVRSTPKSGGKPTLQGRGERWLEMIALE